MASIQRIKSERDAIIYRAQVRMKGQPTQSRNFPNKKEATAWANSIESAIREGRDHPHLAGGKRPFSDLLKKYRETDLKGFPETSRHTREQHLAWWEKRFAGLTLAEITPDRIADARDALAAEKFTRAKAVTSRGKEQTPTQYTRSDGTVTRYLMSLSHVYTKAVKEYRYAKTNPVRDVTKPKTAPGRVRFLSDAERDALLAACQQSDWPALHTLVLLAITTGARRGELINLRWDAIDLKAATAIIPKTKNGDPRSLPLVGKALESLRAMKLQGSARSPWVFPERSEHPNGPYLHFDNFWRKAVEVAGIKNFRFHDLRHTTASYLAANGASLLEIADTLGHRTLSMVKRYAHLTQTHKVSAIEKMAKERGL